ncbi:3-deoxy-7-phosphoheptulonate synthase [Kibdelosporangium banguiense]|uniref:Phospho-2-dehydro-3-deoxyheptonate aldolase n=1 Tax=Kibdelosporangium banguiense TaxID=1365924 RepID=A0ABS4U0A7_9PSEU|nr:3-deoxy-7-phosphoheptulonate synthase [Kibdelosporangium banguiense]MBP2329678.1 3-deoxy-7-phosphoheptulonate synthase [Kibdelosporangium banguiense]
MRGVTNSPRKAARQWHPASWRTRSAAQQPDWPDPCELARVRTLLGAAPALTTPAEVRVLRRVLAGVGEGRAFVIQGGDCAEPFGEQTVHAARAKRHILNMLADEISLRLGVPAVVVGRVAGQFAKPRSVLSEVVDGEEMPAFRGLAVNSPEPIASARRASPERMLAAYYSALAVRTEVSGGLWTSHEALLLDYEEALVRTDPRNDEWYLSSAHFPWIGDRTREVGGAHVEFLSGVANPVACKIGPTAKPDGIVQLCGRLDPHRTPGKLTLICRLGAGQVRDHLPRLVKAVRQAGHPVIWLCDPMHGNTYRTQLGLKTRQLTDIVSEITDCREVLTGMGEWLGGLHLEVAGENVTECVGEDVTEDDLTKRYTSLCDPRLNDSQAMSLVSLFDNGL